jgi:hypothetical protein
LIGPWALTTDGAATAAAALAIAAPRRNLRRLTAFAALFVSDMALPPKVAFSSAGALLFRKIIRLSSGLRASGPILRKRGHGHDIRKT